MPNSSPASAILGWRSRVQQAVNVDELSPVAAFAKVTTEPVDLESLTLAIRAGQPELVQLLLPLVADHSSQDSRQVFAAWSSRSASNSARLSLVGNLKVFHYLLTAGYLPSLELVGKTIFAGSLPFAPPLNHLDWSEFEKTKWHDFHDLQRFWITHQLPLTPLSAGSNAILTTSFFPCLAKSATQTVQFFMELQAHRPSIFASLQAKFQRQFAPVLWQNFFSSHRYSGVDPKLMLKSSYQALARLFPCPTTFPYAPSVIGTHSVGEAFDVSVDTAISHLNAVNLPPQYGTYATPYYVAPITFAAIHRSQWLVTYLAHSEHKSLPALLADVDRLAPEFVQNNSPDTWFYPYLDPAKIDLLTPPSPHRPPLLFNLFSCRQIYLNPSLHQFLVTNLELCKQTLFDPAQVHVQDNFLTHWHFIRWAREPQVRLLDDNFQEIEQLPLSSYGSRLLKESLARQLPSSASLTFKQHL